MVTTPSSRGRKRALWIRPIAWLWAKRAWIASVVGICLIASTLYVLWAIKDLPNPTEDVLAAGDVVVVDRNGKLIEDWNPQGHYHINLTLQEMGTYMPKAVLAAEDRNFYNHGAIDVGSTARALWVDVTSHSLNEGGSSITQQLVKIQLLTPQKSLTRKVQELVLAVTLEQRYSKDQILTMYLNRVYFGHGAYGAGAAARTYFGKDTKNLTPAEAAFLAGLIQAPTAYDPVTHYDLAHQRALYVLDGLVATNVLTRQQADQAGQEDVKAELHIQASARQSKAPHFVDQVLVDLEKMFGAAAIQQGGIVVHTTLDLNLQQMAQESVADGVKDLAWTHVNNSALLAADPRTGEVLAWVGSADYGNDAIAGQYDVVLAERQPGSSFKPYVYEAALRDHKITWATILHDRLTNFNGYTPHDFDNGGMGDITARTAILNSRNIPAVEVGQMEGMQNVISLAHQMGINSPLDPGLSTAIGGSDVTLFEHVQGYQTFADQGQRVDLSLIREVDDAGGQSIYRHDNPRSTTVLTPAEAFLMTDVLKDYQNQWNFGWNRQMASKTGTSDNGSGGIPDSWIMAYNPDIVIGTWVGNTAPNGRGGLITAYGELVGKSVMKRFVNQLPSNMRDWYHTPSGVVIGCGGDRQDPFLPGACNQSPKPSSSPSASASASPSAGPSASASPSASPSPAPSPSPIPSPPSAPPPSPTPAAGGGGGSPTPKATP
ncbi:MAG TPA: transglycosylase domain-containing protein [Candidatus Dormibacteraeota bacterium]|nr:transglycosylase domain-containing protein [Candidatus Dormibacteraeota bacterium]